MPKVSAIIPTYNRATLVKEAVESVLAQTFRDFEVIVVDDGSIDNTRSVIETMDDNRIRYFCKNNGGCASARNFGMAKAHGDFIAFLDSDDLWPKNFLQVMLNHLESKPECGCVYCLVTVTYPDGQKKESYRAEYCKSGWITKDLFKKSFIWIQTTLFRKNALEGIIFDESMRNGADNDVLLRFSTRFQFLFVPDIQIIFRAEHGISPRRDFSSINCNSIRFLERFYFRLGGDKLIPKNIARKRLGHKYRRLAKKYTAEGNRTAAIFLSKQAINYLPLCMRMYWALLRAYLLSKQKDGMPDWEMPEPLGDVAYNVY